MKKTYLCIDLKSFYASVECVERGLNPLNTNLVVADNSRTEKTICLAVTPSMKAMGIPGRARLFEVVKIAEEINRKRKNNAPQKTLTDKSYFASELSENPSLAFDYIVAPPQMALYMEYSARIYNVYLKYVSSEDILVYSIDEVFMDLTPYLSSLELNAHDFAIRIIRDVLRITGITATAGIGTNMYLAKVAMDIKAKKMPADKDGVRIAELDETGYRKELWEHKPLTDFWRIGGGYSKKLRENHMHTMGDVARVSMSEYGRCLLKKLFGINAKLLVDHAWGYEPCSLKEAKSYVPESNSLTTGQVLSCPYKYEDAKLIVKEMTELLVLDMVEKGIVTNQLVLHIGYDVENLKNTRIMAEYKGEIKQDYLGRAVPKHSHGTANLCEETSSLTLIQDAVTELFDRIVNPLLFVRRVHITANNIKSENDVSEPAYEQTDMFTDYSKTDAEREKRRILLDKERRIQKATVEVRSRFGKNSLIKGINLLDGGTTIERNKQIGGHRA